MPDPPPALDSPQRSLTPLLGRDREVAAVKALLLDPAVRLVTLTGPAGVGKTRLAEAVATELRGAFAAGFEFVSLAAEQDPDQVMPRIAKAFRRDADRLQQFLRRRNLLLVLDNLEQILEATPQVTGLVAACPALKVLVTSRIALRVRGERAFPVDPLAVPGPHPLPPEELRGVPAVALFVARAEAVRPSFAISEKNAAAVAAICRQLEGLPLAIELAAARVRVLPPAAIRDRLQQATGGASLELLTGGP